MIGCRCAVCQSSDPRDKRLRCSALVEVKGHRILIDSGPDFRPQALLHHINRLAAILLTHNHYDHLYGLDDVRPLGSVSVYGEPLVLQTIHETMPYCFGEHKYPGSPTIQLHEVTPYEPFDIEGVSILPLRVTHGRLPIVGYRIGSLAYITDASELPEDTYAALRGEGAYAALGPVHTLVLNALRITPHPSHFSLSESIAAAERIGAKNTYFIHFSHDIGLHAEVDASLPAGMHMACDGLQIEIEQ